MAEALAPVDHDPEFDHSLASVDYNPFDYGGVGAAMPEAYADPNRGVGAGIVHAAESLMTLPQRAIENSQNSLDTGTYDPGPTLEAATLPMGTGAIAGVPVRAAETVLGSGAVRGVKSGMSDTFPNIASLQELKDAIANDGGKLFVRWSQGPKYDLKPGAASKDYQTGERHAGLSAVELTDDMSDGQLVRSLRDYSSLRGHKNPGAAPHIYSGKVNGVDSDGAPTIKPSKHIGVLNKPMISLLDDEAAPQRLDLQELSGRFRNLLAQRGPNSAVNEQSIKELEDKLNALGGPVSLPSRQFMPVDHNPFED